MRGQEADVRGQEAARSERKFKSVQRDLSGEMSGSQTVFRGAIPDGHKT